jgi:TonB family protein
MVVPASWVLVRNPDEVDEFMSRVYSRGELEPQAKGSVDVTLWIDERGSVEWAEIAASSGRTDMDEIALALFNEVARFRPAREEGVSISRSVIFTVNFPW